MPEYSEILPPTRLSDLIECFWTSRQTGASSVLHRVVPDGCADLLFIQSGGVPVLQVVGPMTRYEDVPLRPGAEYLGARFRAAMGPAQLGISADEIVDRTIDLECFWGARARRLRERLANAKAATDRTALLCDSFGGNTPRSGVQQAIGVLECRGGGWRLDVLASQAGLSMRQFRRRCVEESGLSPKLFARILRFRRAWQSATAKIGEHAGLAAEFGFADQSHMIAEFRRFSGRTPTQRTN